MVVADKNCSKIHFISPNIYCCGAGTAADTDMTTQLISSNLELHSLSTGRLPRVVTANRMLKQMLFRYQGYIGAALVLGGVDVTGPHLYSIYPHGSTDKLPYVTMGSGSLAAMAIFEDKYKQDMESLFFPASTCVTLHLARVLFILKTWATNPWNQQRQRNSPLSKMQMSKSCAMKLKISSYSQLVFKLVF
ncbi:proteasome subunit beta type-7 isoform X1 [Egretta garzetta]|uniref:proteasome subunit beta type-7 isoform X1 n=1 Tax=Egretta garzetta TaxID=188379 RepID=UPI00163C6DED|nr:proteasome subunit beta type-7 isoform X1 [Egretta garzetta]